MTEPEGTEASEKILRRIRGLLDRAEHDGTDQNEAEACMAKAMQLMADYGIQRAMLAASGGTDDPIDCTVIPMSDPYSYEKGTLLQCVVNALNCKAIHHRNGRRTCRVSVVGAASTRERVEILYTSLLIQAERGMLREVPSGTGNTRALRASFLAGFGSRVGQRLAEAEQRAAHLFDAQHPASPDAPATPGTAIVLARRDALIEQRYAELFPQTRTGRERGYNSHGYQRGDEAGRRADIGTTRVTGAGSRSLEGTR